jgi:hypothetical protein
MSNGTLHPQEAQLAPKMPYNDLGALKTRGTNSKRASALCASVRTILERQSHLC